MPQHNYCTVLIATYNRLPLLKQTLASVREQTSRSFDVIVIDGGSTDGTVDFLKTQKTARCVFQGKLLGTARTYNDVWRSVESVYTCWLSDDTVVVNRGIDAALDILERHPDIGMVGLKMKDISGPWKSLSFKAGISEYGIVNCNHGVLSYGLLKRLGFFNTAYFSYTIDPDLTASVLCSGKSVVMTKSVSVLHHREWSESLSKDEAKNRVHQTMKGRDNARIYRKKFQFLSGYEPTGKTYVARPLNYLIRASGRSYPSLQTLLLGRFISLTDPLMTARERYHLVQRIPPRLLASTDNPYLNLCV